MIKTMPRLLQLIIYFLSSTTLLLVHSDIASDRAALVSFITSVPHSRSLNWNTTSPFSPCDWFGITCNPNSNSSVLVLRLPAVGLLGPIPSNTLSRLSSLRVLSLHSNHLSGPLPDLANLTLLRALYLHNNRFSGVLPANSLASLRRLSRVDVSSNDLSGNLPEVFNSLVKLAVLLLNNNSFSGTLPALSIESLIEFNVSYNQLHGSIPLGLARFNASSFAGNRGLCGVPLSSCNRQSKKSKLSRWTIVALAMSAGVVLFMLAMLVFICVMLRRRGRKHGRDSEKKKKKNKKEMVIKGGKDVTVIIEEMQRKLEEETAAMTSSSGGERNKLVFVGKDGGYSFDLEDLLRASAEVLGKGSMGMTYKAVLEDGSTVAVKRLKDVSATKRYFEYQVGELGKLEHENLMPIRAYYYSKDEKLLVLDYLDGCSLSFLLHGCSGSGQTPLDWDSRIRIATAAARGLSHLHTVDKIVHGNVKASNVLVRSDPDASALTDSGLHLLFSSSVPPNRLIGYRAPELVDKKRPTFKSDVYSFGVLLLELVTGKAPEDLASFGEDNIDMPHWVQSIPQEEWKSQVLDTELMRYPNIEDEIVQLLQIALACVAVVPHSRPKISQVLQLMGAIGNRVEEYCSV